MIVANIGELREIIFPYSTLDERYKNVAFMRPLETVRDGYRNCFGGKGAGRTRSNT